jgi:endonuclease YncB( thermonuclease family)
MMMTSKNATMLLDLVLMLCEIALYVVPIAIAGLLLWNVIPKTYAVTKVVDGDSLEVRRGKRHLRLRIKYFDAPEFHQDGGQEARAHLAKLLTRGALRMGHYEIDAYDRALGRCYIGWMPVDWLMISAGHAWPTSTLGQIIAILPRIRRRGLWAMRRPIHPSVWRRARIQTMRTR